MINQSNILVLSNLSLQQINLLQSSSHSQDQLLKKMRESKIQKEKEECGQALQFI
jgi:hypothetical protein